MPSANELGLIDSNESTYPTKLEAGMTLEVIALPEFKPKSEDFEFDSVVLTTKEGKQYYTTSNVIIGSLKSTNPKSTGAVLRKAITEHNNSLTCYINEKTFDTGRKGLSIGLFR
jgi:hypothetical protein